MYETRQKKVCMVVQNRDKRRLSKGRTIKDFRKKPLLYNTIQQTPIDAQRVWQQRGLQGICNYENIILQWRQHQGENPNPIQQIVDEWNRDSAILIQDNDLAGGINRINQNKQQWADRKRMEQNLTPIENYLKDNATFDFDIDYDVAMIGRDTHQEEPQNDSLYQEVLKWQNENQKIPFTLTAFLRMTNQNWSEGASKTFVQTIIANSMKVIVAPSHVDKIDGNIRKSLNFSRLPELYGAVSEIRFLACYGYRQTDNNKLERKRNNNRAAGGHRNGTL